ncbi:MAG TPA: glycosyltransferase family 4 protein [Solirubrobacteraceae bacterium]|jgi:glycosyltransferase involved in cell wall biosynthesis|nr:glycosyltransferase family 4 protein [Solirubrobacteraceae bacterium]
MSSSEMPRSVLIVMPRWVRDGGVGAHLMRSAEALAGAGVRVDVLVARIETDERVEGVELHHSPLLYKTSEMEPRFALALEREPEVVHLNQLDDPDVVAFMRRHAAVAISAHGYLACASGLHYFHPGHACGRAHGSGCVPNLLLRGCAHRWDISDYPGDYRQAGRATRSLQTADIAIGYSHAMERHLRRAGVERRRVVPYFPTLELPEGGAEAGRRIMFAGRMVPAKGGATLLHALRLIDAELVVCGDGVQLGKLRALADRLGVADRVAFRGWLAPDELAREFTQAAVVAVPSLWPEPFGLVGIEGFAAGRAAVGSATGGIPEWLEDGVSGLTVQPGDIEALAAALGELLDDPERRAEMGRAGRAAVEARYSRERHLSALLGAYGDARTRWAAERAASPAFR